MKRVHVTTGRHMFCGTAASRVQIIYLAAAAGHNDVLGVFGVGLDLDVLAAAGRLHREVPDPGAEVAPDLEHI